MAIENRNLAAGTKLTARYRKVEHSCVASFTAPAGEEPAECPAGHKGEDAELTAPVSAEVWAE